MPVARPARQAECCHAYVKDLHGGWEHLPERRSYWTVHNNPIFVAECNRIAPELTYAGDAFTMKRPTRVPIPGAVTKRGRPRTKTVRIQAGHPSIMDPTSYIVEATPTRYIALRG
jgi:hypothetical protein